MRILNKNRYNSVCFDSSTKVSYSLEHGNRIYMGRFPYILFGLESSYLYGGSDPDGSTFGGLICVF